MLVFAFSLLPATDAIAPRYRVPGKRRRLVHPRMASTKSLALLHLERSHRCVEVKSSSRDSRDVSCAHSKGKQSMRYRPEHGQVAENTCIVGSNTKVS